MFNYIQLGSSEFDLRLDSIGMLKHNSWLKPVAKSWGEMGGGGSSL